MEKTRASPDDVRLLCPRLTKQCVISMGIEASTGAGIYAVDQKRT
jgi:hypothetical protein